MSYDSIYTKCPQQANLCKQKIDFQLLTNGVRGLRGECKRGREQEVTANGYGAVFRGDENVLKLNCGDGPQLCKYAKKH